MPFERTTRHGQVLARGGHFETVRTSKHRPTHWRVCREGTGLYRHGADAGRRAAGFSEEERESSTTEETVYDGHRRLQGNGLSRAE